MKNYKIKSEGVFKNIISKYFVILFISVILIIFILGAFLPGILVGIQYHHEAPCVQKLYEISKAEKKYYALYGRYASLHKLYDNNILRNNNGSKKNDRDFDLALFEINDPINTEKSPSFTIVALPVIRYKKPYYQLRTFAINEKNDVLLWIGDDAEFSLKSIQLNNRKNWGQLKNINWNFRKYLED